MQTDSNISAILEFWIGPAATDAALAKTRGKLWYQASDSTDDEIRHNFATSLELAERHELTSWQESAEGSLALVILLDQFSRNLYRGTSRAFSNDNQALEVATDAIRSGQDAALSLIGRAFLYHPLHHSEDISVQNHCVDLFESLLDDASLEWKEQMNGFLDYAKEHRDVVKRFGRFPHRNQVLGRKSTDEEKGYLDGGASRYGQ